MRYRLIKPEWAKPKLANGEPNPLFKEEIEGLDVIEADNLSEKYLKEKNEAGYNVYYFPNHNSSPVKGWLSGKDVDTFNCVFVDMDLKDGVYKDKESFLQAVMEFLEPNRIVDSGHGIHAYWDIQGLTKEQYVELQLRLIKRLNTDQSVWTVMQLMRLPGYYNTKKYKNWVLAEEFEGNETAYQYKDLDSALPPLSSEGKQKAQQHINRVNGIHQMPDLTDLNMDELPEKFVKLLKKNTKAQKLWEEESPGNRSENDYKLACLLFKKDFSKPDAVRVLVHTAKARSHKDPLHYASVTVDKAYGAQTDFVVTSVADYERLGLKDQASFGAPINGPSYWCEGLEKSWRKSQVLGMIAGTGVGKSAATLACFREMIERNPTDDIFIFYSLEMPEWEIIERWTALNADTPEYSERLYVVANEDTKGNPRHINLQKMYWYANNIQKQTGKSIGAIAIDHIGIIDNSIDVSKEPTFGQKGDDVGFGVERTISFETICAKMKELAKLLNCFVIVQSQTTKEKAQGGDVKLEIDAAYGTAKFEWYVDYILTFWQPLRRVETKTDLRVLAWQYCKIRTKSKKDTIKIYDPRVLRYDLETGRISDDLDKEEVEEVNLLEQEAAGLRSQSKKKGIEYKGKIDLDKAREAIESYKAKSE